MNIEGKDLAKVDADLKWALANGLNYIVIDRIHEHFSVESQRLFASKQEGELHLLTNKETYKEGAVLLPVQLMERSFARSLEFQREADPTLSKPYDIYVHLNYLANQEVVRQQIYSRELQDQLIKSGFTSEIGELLKHGIKEDLPHFEFNGTRLVQGRAELHTVRIEQNPDRGLEVKSIMPELEARMSKVDWKHVYYDPLEQNVEITKPEERAVMQRVWKIVEDLNDLSKSSEKGYAKAQDLQVKYWQGTNMEDNVLPAVTVQSKTAEMIKQDEILGGTIRTEDALKLKDYLRSEKEAGNRFVSFESGQPALMKDHFVPFKSAFSALEHAYENTTDTERYIVRSIQVVEKEVDKILESDKVKALEKESANTFQLPLNLRNDQQKNINNNKDQGLSR